jgi:two-component system chemotaxis response regulator CheY
MSVILIVTPDASAQEKIEPIAIEYNYRLKHIASIEAAEEWLELQTFDVILVDSRFDNSEPVELLSKAWHKNPFILGALFNLEEKVEGVWAAVLQGAKVFSGDSALRDLRQCLQTLPKEIHLASQTEMAILIVEDLDAPRDIICAYVESMGYPRVDGVSSADECLKLLDDKPNYYFCVISDLFMPKFNGMQLIQEIRCREKTAGLPVIILTSAPTTDNLLDCVKAGATGFLAKPLNKKILRAELEKAKRIRLSRQSARLCAPEEAHLLEDALLKIAR